MTRLSDWQKRPQLAQELARTLNEPHVRLAVEVLDYEGRYATQQISTPENVLTVKALMCSYREGWNACLSTLREVMLSIPSQMKPTDVLARPPVLRDETPLPPPAQPEPEPVRKTPRKK